MPSALDHASKSSHNELHADLPVWDSEKTNKQTWAVYAQANLSRKGTDLLQQR